MSAKTKRKDVTEFFLSAPPSFTIHDIKFSEKQRQVNKVLKDSKVVFLSGPAGTSKTFCAVFGGLMALRSGAKEKLKYIRAAVESSQSRLGYLPGDVNDKISPFCLALHDKLYELVSAADAAHLLQKGLVECLSPNFLRGTTFSNSFVIIDEAQQMSKRDLITTLSRIGENTTMVFCYDSMQADIRNSGIEELAQIFDDEESQAQGIHQCKFGREDVRRSAILAYIVGKLEDAAK